MSTNIISFATLQDRLKKKSTLHLLRIQNSQALIRLWRKTSVQCNGSVRSSQEDSLWLSIECVFNSQSAEGIGK